MSNALMNLSQTAVSLDHARGQVHLISDAQEGRAVAEKIEAMRAAFAKLHVAEADRIAAVRLELAILRRIGQLGGDGVFTSTLKRSAIRGLAALDDDDFELLLIESAEATTPLAAWRDRTVQTPAERARAAEWARKQEEKRAEFWRRIETEDGFREAVESAEVSDRDSRDRAEDARRRSSRIREAVGDLIAETDLSDSEFTTRELAERLYEDIKGFALSEEFEYADDPGLSEMIAEVVRGGLRESRDHAEYPFSRLTYHDADLGYVHIPWQIASVHHLVAYASYAQKQADEMQAKADRVASVRDAYVAALAGASTATKLVQLSVAISQ